MRPSSLNPQSPRPISTEPAWLLWSEAETSDQDLSSTIHQLNIISFPPQSSDGYTYAHIIGLQTLERALARGGGGGAMRAGEPLGDQWCSGASNFQTSLRRICFASLTRNTPARWQKWVAPRCLRHIRPCTTWIMFDLLRSSVVLD